MAKINIISVNKKDLGLNLRIKCIYLGINILLFYVLDLIIYVLFLYVLIIFIEIIFKKLVENGNIHVLSYHYYC